MKIYTVLAGLASLLSLASAQVTILPNGTFSCALPDANYCAGPSLSTNIIFRCTNGTGQPGNCNDNLAGVPPVGVKPGAPCWESSDIAGDAACSWDGIVYPDSGNPFPIPTNGSTVTSSTAAVGPTGYSTGGVGPTASATYSKNATIPTAQPSQYTGAAAPVRIDDGKIIAGLLGAAGLLLGL